MNNEERFLVLKDLSNRLTTDVKVVIADNPTKILYLNGGMIDLMWEGKVEYKPYLRPMDSMTDDEKREYNFTKTLSIHDYPTIETYDWLNKHHFDYRGLIEKGLALEATPDIYPNIIKDRELLLKDLCGRLPYGVVAFKTYKEGSKTMESTFLIETDDIDMLLGTVEDMEEAHYTIKPYLRPMSSMTEEEFKEYEKENDIDTADSSETLKENLKAKARVRVSKWYHGSDWLNAHHFDYRGLIEKGLALEAPEDMYKN